MYKINNYYYTVSSGGLSVLIYFLVVVCKSSVYFCFLLQVYICIDNWHV